VAQRWRYRVCPDNPAGRAPTRTRHSLLIFAYYLLLLLVSVEGDIRRIVDCNAIPRGTKNNYCRESLSPNGLTCFGSEFQLELEIAPSGVSSDRPALSRFSARPDMHGTSGDAINEIFAKCL